MEISQKVLRVFEYSLLKEFLQKVGERLKNTLDAHPNYDCSHGHEISSLMKLPYGDGSKEIYYDFVNHCVAGLYPEEAFIYFLPALLVNMPFERLSLLEAAPNMEVDERILLLFIRLRNNYFLKDIYANVLAYFRELLAKRPSSFVLNIVPPNRLKQAARRDYWASSEHGVFYSKLLLFLLECDDGKSLLANLIREQSGDEGPFLTLFEALYHYFTLSWTPRTETGKKLFLNILKDPHVSFLVREMIEAVITSRKCASIVSGGLKEKYES